MLSAFDEIFEIENGTLIAYRGHDSAVLIPDEVTVIGNYAFNDCASIETVVIPESVTEIGNMAFANCDKLKSVTIPDNVKTLGSSCFSDCKRLESVFIGAGVTAIGESPFIRSSTLCDIRVSGESAGFKATDGVLYTKDGRLLIAYPAGKKDTAFAVPDGVIAIAVAAFWGAESLTEITLPDSVTHIGNFAFQYCTGLAVIAMSASLKVLGGCVFGGCEALKQVRLPKTLTSVSYHAVADCPTVAICSARKPMRAMPTGWHKEWCGKNTKVRWGRKFKKQVKVKR